MKTGEEEQAHVNTEEEAKIAEEIRLKAEEEEHARLKA